MEEIGQGRGRLVAAPAWGFAGSALVLCLAACACAWPFALDDAFIGLRYARHLGAGEGYVWNVGGAPTDGVTPLPWAPLLALLVQVDPVVALTRVKLAGALAWGLGAFAWGLAVGRTGARWWTKAGALAVLVVDLPVAAHAVGGMELPLAMTLAALAALLHGRPRLAALVAGVGATLRPELVVWGVVVATGFALLEGGERRARACLGAAVVAVGPFLLCAVVRVALFGRPAPLSLLAKPSDLSHGLAYAGAAAIFTLAPLVVLSPWAFARERGPGAVLTLAGLAHFGVIVAVGGDWMPFARLAAPVVPSLLYAFVLAAPHAARWASAGRLSLVLVLAGWLVPHHLGELRRAGADRRVMIERARPLLARAKVLAAVDIGWVSAVSERTIVDLAGVTDPEVAVLQGGHTSKRVSPSMLTSRSVDTAVFYASPLPGDLSAVTPASFPRVVERRLAGSDAFAGRFVPAAILPLRPGETGYVLYVRR